MKNAAINLESHGYLFLPAKEARRHQSKLASPKNTKQKVSRTQLKSMKKKQDRAILMEIAKQKDGKKTGEDNEMSNVGKGRQEKEDSDNVVVTNVETDQQSQNGEEKENHDEVVLTNEGKDVHNGEGKVEKDKVDVTNVKSLHNDVHEDTDMVVKKTLAKVPQNDEGNVEKDNVDVTDGKTVHNNEENECIDKVAVTNISKSRQNEHANEDKEELLVDGDDPMLDAASSSVNVLSLRSQEILRFHPFMPQEDHESDAEYENRDTSRHQAYQIEKLTSENKRLRHERDLYKSMLGLMKEDLPKLIKSCQRATIDIDRRISGPSGEAPNRPQGIHESSSASSSSNNNAKIPKTKHSTKRHIQFEHTPAKKKSNNSSKEVHPTPSSTVTSFQSYILSSQQKTPSNNSPPRVEASPALGQDSSSPNSAETVTVENLISDFRRCRCNHKKASLLTCDLLSALFPVNVLQRSSITGGRSNTSAKDVEAKDKLDPQKLAAICDYVKKHFPGEETAKIHMAVRNKLKNVATKNIVATTEESL